jgi:S1-C subfamily serine protease
MRLLPLLTAIAALAMALGTCAPAHAQRAPESRAEIALSFAPVARRAAPAVVSINTRRTVRSQLSPFTADPLFWVCFSISDAPGTAHEAGFRNYI